MGQSEREKILDALGLVPEANLEAVLLRIETIRADQQKWWRVERFVANGARESSHEGK